MEPLEWAILAGGISLLTGTVIVANGAADGIAAAEQKVAVGASVAAVLVGAAVIVYAYRKSA